jgi:hypothetical protein
MRNDGERRACPSSVVARALATMGIVAVCSTLGVTIGVLATCTAAARFLSGSFGSWTRRSA